MGIRVGITVVGQHPQAGSDPERALWSSGIAQNIIFLAMLLRRLPEVERVALVSCPVVAQGETLAHRYGLESLSEAEAVGALDILIEFGARGSSAAMAAFRASGGKLVSYVAGNVVAMNFEQLACFVPHGEVMSQAFFDAVWITPQHWRMNRSYAAVTRSEKVAMAPHIWAPDVLTQSAARFRTDLFWKDNPRRSGARVGVFDPNVNVLKTFHLPLLACEQAERFRPGAIERVLLFSAAHLKGLAHAEEFIAATDLGRTGRVSVEYRAPLPEVLGPLVDVVVTLLWEIFLFYLFWDSLYAGYPLVHNAGPIADVGYYYGDFDPQAGGRALLSALDNHAGNRARARPQELQALWARHIDNPDNQRVYSALIADVARRP